MKKRYTMTLVIIAILIISTLYSGITYSLWNKTFYTEKPNTIKSGCIIMENFHDSIIERSSTEKLEPLPITLTNTCENEQEYAILLNLMEINENNIDLNKIKYAFSEENNPQEYTPLKNAKKNPDAKTSSYILKNGKLNIGETKNIQLYVWIDEYDKNQNNETFRAEISLSSSKTENRNLTNETIQKLSQIETNNIVEIPVKKESIPTLEYRFSGSNPNNYVLFHKESWRIIGLVNNGDSQSYKIIKTNPLDLNHWDNQTKTNWSISTLKTYLNEEYLSKFEEKDRNRIKLSTWNSGSIIDYSNATTNTFYEEEKVLTEHKPEYIGLISPSDYGYSSSGGEKISRSMCLSTPLNQWSTLEDCISSNWIYRKEINQWTLNTTLEKNSILKINNRGVITNDDSETKTAIFPSVYLSDEIKFVDGDGTQLNPYQITI